MEILLLLAYLLKTLGFATKKLCDCWLNDDWFSNPPNFGFQVSRKNNTGPVLHGNATNGILCPWPSKPWV
jgi:hypothetical protein